MVCLESVGKLLFLPLLPVLHNLFQSGKSGSQFCHFYHQKVQKKSKKVGEVVKVTKISSKKVAPIVEEVTNQRSFIAGYKKLRRGQMDSLDQFLESISIRTNLWAQRGWSDQYRTFTR